MNDTARTVRTIEPPAQYGAVFDRASRRYMPLLEEAKETLRSFPVPDAIRPHYLQIVDGRPQPAFILLPLLSLHLAEATGGVTARHRAYLPWQMLAFELIALYDDTVDYTPTRSGVATYTARHGAAAAAALSGFLFSVVSGRTSEICPELSPHLTRMFENLCAMELWEHESRYPQASPPAIDRWIRRRYDAVPPCNAYVLDGALELHGLPPIAAAVHRYFGDLMQDVDDLVSIVEERDKQGENCDLRMGIPSYPLLATLRAEPSAAVLLEELWRPYRALPRRARHEHHEDIARIERDTARAHGQLVELILAHGVNATVAKVLHEAERVTELSPAHARSCMREYAYSVVDRLRDIHPRARIEQHVPGGPSAERCGVLHVSP